MTKRRQFCIVFFLFSVLSALAIGKQQAFGGDPHMDFWWDYGERDEKHATFAPAMDKEISRKTEIEVVALEKHKVFVADEYLQVRYLIRVPFDVRIDEKKLPHDLAPFEIYGFHFGPRRPLKNDRDMELQELLLTLRLDAAYPYDTYSLPSFDLHYQYDAIVGKSRIAQRETAATGTISLEKVPVYARVVQQRNTGFLWDIFPCLVEIHADNSVNFLNLSQNSEADSLMQFKPVYPFVMHDHTRSTIFSSRYRVIRYQFMIAVQDFREQPFALTFPQIIWQRQGASAGSKNVITPDSPVFFIRRITADPGRLAAFKENVPEVPGERYRLLELPLQIIWTIITLGLAWFSFLAWQFHNLKKKTATAPRIDKALSRVHDRWPWQNFTLGLRIIRARHAFHKKPGQKNCACLRELLARRSVLRLQGKHKITVAEACALTADELAQRGSRKQDIAELLQLEHQLESGQYNAAPDMSQEQEE